MSWGPLIHGHAPRGLVKALASGGTRRHELRRAEPARSRARRARPAADAVARARPLRQLRHRSDDERGPRRARGDQARARSSSSKAAITATPIAFLVQAGSGALTLGVPTSPGVTRGAAGDTLIASYNDLASVDRAVRRQPRSDRRAHRRADRRQHGRRAAGRRLSARAPRRLCTAHGALLIFDEVISGFRAAPGGAQALFGVTPDLTCLGKIIGGGLPVGAYGGRADLMELVSPAGPVYQAGTLSGNPLAMTAGIWCLDRADAAALPPAGRARRRGSPPVSPTPRATPASPLQVNAFGSLLTPFFTDRPVRDYQSATSADTDTLRARSSAACSRAASIRRRRSSKRGSCRRRTRRRMWTRRSPRRGRRCGKLQRRLRSPTDRTMARRTSVCMPQSEPSVCDLRCLAKIQRRIQPHAQHRSGRQLDVLAFGRRDRAAAADQNAGHRAFDAAEDAADDRADAGAGADLRRPRPGCLRSRAPASRSRESDSRGRSTVI